METLERTSVVGRLEGDWRVERLSGALPPMMGVWKRIRGGRGETWIGPLPAWPFRAEQRAGFVALVYHRPFSMFTDEVTEQEDGSWTGRSLFAGQEVGRFRIVRYGGLAARRASGRGEG